MTAPKRGCYCHMLHSTDGLCHVCEVQTRWDDRRWNNSGGRAGWTQRHLPPAPTAAEERLIAIDMAVRAAVQHCYPSAYKCWGSEGNVLLAVGYLREERAANWVGQHLRHEIANQFRKLTEKPNGEA